MTLETWRTMDRSHMMRCVFPQGFVWGTATSAYQIEGATSEDGRGESIWDRFSRTPSATKDGMTGDVACDHYHRYREDVALMQSLGLGAYRFSAAWPRILPLGRGAVNARGLDFYSRLVDCLLEHGIEPFVTLYHWDLPQRLQDEGGWTNRTTVDAFAEYADLVSRHLGDRVKHWITHNEPWCASHLGHRTGIHAPGLRDWRAALEAAHHLLLSHGVAVPVIRANAPGAEVGITLNMSPVVPASRSAEDYDTYRHFDGCLNRWFLDPLYRGHYPADVLGDYIKNGYVAADDMGVVLPGDMQVIAAPIDFVGVNYYSRTIARSDRISEEQNQPPSVHAAPESQWTDMGWEVYPEGLFQVLMRLTFEYGVPKIYVTENGASFSQGPDASNRVADTRRVRYLRDHFLAAKRAIDGGVPLRGYFVWTFLDNFEWDRGYTQRFGITWTDYETQRRVPKDSALWYTKVIAENALPLD
jgi:beta-glucosidase